MTDGAKRSLVDRLGLRREKDAGAEPPDGERSSQMGKIDLRNTWQIVAGSILVPLGIVFILLAWYGAAHTKYVQQQIPYEVSGAFIGLGCMILGGLLYWAHWLYRMYDQADQHHEEHLRAIDHQTQQIVERLSNSFAAEPGRSVAYPPPPAARTRYVATASGTVYHVPGCSVVAHHADGLRILGPDDVSGMEPCRLCEPTAA